MNDYKKLDHSKNLLKMLKLNKIVEIKSISPIESLKFVLILTKNNQEVLILSKRIEFLIQQKLTESQTKMIIIKNHVNIFDFIKIIETNLCFKTLFIYEVRLNNFEYIFLKKYCLNKNISLINISWNAISCNYISETDVRILNMDIKIEDSRILYK